MLLVTVIVALVLGWGIDRSRLLTANREAVSDATNLAKWTSLGRLRGGTATQFRLLFLQQKYGGGPIRLAPGEAERLGWTTGTVRVKPPAAP
jgi:hypothetical protein